MSTPRQLANAAINSFMRLSPEDQRVLLEMLRRVTAGAPREHAIEQVTGSRSLPAQWMPAQI